MHYCHGCTCPTLHDGTYQCIHLQEERYWGKGTNHCGKSRHCGKSIFHFWILFACLLMWLMVEIYSHVNIEYQDMWSLILLSLLFLLFEYCFWSNFKISGMHVSEQGRTIVYASGFTRSWCFYVTFNLLCVFYFGVGYLGNQWTYIIPAIITFLFVC